MRDARGSPLRTLLQERAKAVSEAAAQAGGQVSADEVEALGRLARLAEICDAAQPAPRRRRWPVIAILVGTLLIVSVLLFARVSETEIELDLAVAEAGFVLSEPQPLADVMRLSALGVSGLQEIRLPRARDRAARTLRGSEGMTSDIRLSVASDAERQGTVTLAALTLPAGTRVWVRTTEVPHEYRLSLNGTGLELAAHVNGSVRLESSGTSPERLDVRSPRSVLLRAGPNEVVDLDLTFPGASWGTFSPQLAVKDLSLLRVDEFMDAERTMVRRVSSVLSGSLYFESLNGQERMLRPGEGIRFGSSRGEIRSLRLNEDHIVLKFHGRVRAMSTGSGEARRSLMPIYLEWVRARHGLSLLWGTTLYLFSLIVGALRWWREPL